MQQPNRDQLPIMGMAEAIKRGESWWAGGPAQPEAMRPITLVDAPPFRARPDAPVAAPVRKNTCAACAGDGYYLEAVPYGHPRFGVLMECECTRVAKAAEERAVLLAASNLGAYAHKTFASYNGRVVGVALALKHAKAFASAPRGFLVLAGSIGCGKTHLAAAIANEAVGQSKGVYFATVPDMLDRLRSGYDKGADETYLELMRQVCEVEVLVLDDLGTEDSTKPWVKEKLFQIVNHRYNFALPTIITLNPELTKLDPRIESRIGERTLNPTGIIKISAADQRKREVQP